MTRNYPQFFAICRSYGLDKADLASEISGGRTASLRSLTDQEWAGIMEQLTAMQKGKSWSPPPGDVQRKKMISIARQMNWHLVDGKDKGISQIRTRLDAWAQQQKFKKTLMGHTVPELNVLVSIFEEKVYRSYLEGLNQ